MRTTFPQSHQIDQAAHDAALLQPPARMRYVIFFTPRAGSSWLTDILTQTGQMGRPEEWYNPRHLNARAQKLNAWDLPSYAAMIERLRQSGGVSGVEITHHQLRAVFKTHDRFRALYPDPHTFWLIRKDIVAQAVSLYKMTETRVSHSTKISAEDIAAREARFIYDPDRIQHWITHIRLAEDRTEALLVEAGWTPLRLWYEWNMQVGPQVTINRMAESMGLPRLQRGNPFSAHRKIATGKNAEFAERFCSDRPEFLKHLIEDRAPLLQKFIPYRQQLNARSALAA